MEKIRIRIPKKVLEKINSFIENDLFSSRNNLIREVLRNYINNSQFFGIIPYIIGPFSQKGLNNLRKNMANIENLKINEKDLKDLQNKFTGVEF